MGKLSSYAMDGGLAVGGASCDISEHADPSAHLQHASELFFQLAPVVIVQVDVNSVHTEQDIIQLRERIADTLNRSNKPGLHAAYQLGLHFGLALGQAGVPEQFSWPKAVAECKVAMQQVQQDIRDPALNFLATAQIDQELARIAAYLNPQQRTDQASVDLATLNGGIGLAIADAPSIA
jgi:hypothetical protein